ncbi:peptidoglycan L-alanyl-D-glutamate endopeptidase CwlK [Duganella sp. 3397]|uniref:M15 family metallopeptidase n=1 Tax=Duganella sp. 3397 TaxID=2817732 RepID=UPI002855B4A5|nr:M15 family metallopeptidase [Duganella sp. 3397]MDR7049123.1 peptidoglycan L-alanyl-D-glutamate endopeptidase CwlK [Duganella sp. 3397]
MLLLAVVLYFLLACAACWLLFFPAGRSFVGDLVARTDASVRRAVTSMGRRRATGAAAASAAITRAAPSFFSAGDIGSFMRRHAVLCIAGLLLVSVPPLVAFFAGGKIMLGGYDVSTREVNTQVAELLQGEQLVPPVALPPAVFASAAIERERPMLVSASRNWDLMNQEYTQRLLMVFKIMKEQHGYDMAILEGYRSPERQNMLAGMGTNVTNAAAFQSWHQYGLAADCAFLRDGKLVISEKDPWAMRGYQLYGEVAESVGLTWGGRWKMMDFGHTELRLPGVMKRKG